MAVIKQGILGGFQNKVGSVVGSSWKGIAVMKAKPLSVANPRTSAQQTNRYTFKNCAQWFSAINASTIKPLWDRFAIKQSGYNAAVAFNFDNFSDTGVLTPTGIKISNGKMEATPVTFSADRSGNEFQLDWTAGTGSGFKTATDQLLVVVWNEPKNEFYQTGVSAIARSEEQAQLPLPASWQVGDTLYMYTSFRRVDGTVVDISYVSSQVIVA